MHKSQFLAVSTCYIIISRSHWCQVAKDWTILRFVIFLEYNIGQCLDLAFFLLWSNLIYSILWRLNKIYYYKKKNKWTVDWNDNPFYPGSVSILRLAVSILHHIKKLKKRKWQQGFPKTLAKKALKKNFTERLKSWINYKIFKIILHSSLRVIF